MKEIITGIFIGTTKDFQENKDKFILNVNCGREELNGALNLKLLQRDNRGFVGAYNDNATNIMEKWTKGNVLLFCNTGIHKSCEFASVMISKIYNLSIDKTIKLICSKKEDAFERYCSQILLWYLNGIKEIIRQEMG